MVVVLETPQWKHERIQSSKYESIFYATKQSSSLLCYLMANPNATQPQNAFQAKQIQNWGGGHLQAGILYTMILTH